MNCRWTRNSNFRLPLTPGAICLYNFTTSGPRTSSRHYTPYKQYTTYVLYFFAIFPPGPISISIYIFESRICFGAISILRTLSIQYSISRRSLFLRRRIKFPLRGGTIKYWLRQSRNSLRTCVPSSNCAFVRKCCLCGIILE